jgi:hypothetical protein
MQTTIRLNLVTQIFGLALLLGGGRLSYADEAKTSYPSMAPLEQYRVANASEEITLSRSAAPSSISADATILTLGDRGYQTSLKGKNGFVCLVQRSWASGFDDDEFWNPKLRAPICFNPAAARTVLPAYLERTEWVLSGIAQAEMVKRTHDELAKNGATRLQPGAMAFMMSKQGYLGDRAGHWHSHLMFFYPQTDVPDWGADLDGSPVFAASDDSQMMSTFFVLAPTWSDGTSAVM